MQATSRGENGKDLEHGFLDALEGKSGAQDC